MTLNPILTSIIQLTLSEVNEYDTNLYKLLRGTMIYALEEDKARNTIIEAVGYANRYGISPIQISSFASNDGTSIPMALINTADCLLSGLKSYIDYYQEVSPYFSKMLSLSVLGEKLVIDIGKSQSKEEIFYHECLVFQTIFLIKLIKPKTKILVELTDSQFLSFEKTIGEHSLDVRIVDNVDSGFRLEVSGQELVEENPFYEPAMHTVLKNLKDIVKRPKTKYSAFIKRYLYSKKQPAAERLKDVSDVLKISERKIKRLLKEEGTTFTDISRDVILSRTILGLSRKQDIDSFASDLGYSDRSGLAHLFKQISGTPLSTLIEASSRLTNNKGRSFALRSITNLYPLDDTIYGISSLIAKDDFLVTELTNKISADLGAITSLTRLASSAYYSISAKSLHEIVIKLGPIFSANFVISSSMGKALDSSRIAIPINTILSLPLAIAEVLQAVGKPNLFGPATFFIPAVLFIAYDLEVLNLKKGTQIDITGVENHLLDLSERIDLKISEIIRMVVLGFGLPSAFTKSITSAIVQSEQEYGDHIFRYVIGIAVHFKAKRYERVNLLVNSINELHPELKLELVPILPDL